MIFEASQPWVLSEWRPMKVVMTVLGCGLGEECSARRNSRTGQSLILQGDRKGFGRCCSRSSSPRKRSVDQALMYVNEKANRFKERSHTCSPSVERRCVELIIIVT